jgi:hypothetical protein
MARNAERPQENGGQFPTGLLVSRPATKSCRFRLGQTSFTGKSEMSEAAPLKEDIRRLSASARDGADGRCADCQAAVQAFSRCVNDRCATSPTLILADFCSGARSALLNMRFADAKTPERSDRGR